MNEAIGDLLPFAVAVGLSPVPVIAVVAMLTTPRAGVNGAAFTVGWITGLVVVGAVVLLAAASIDATDRDGPATWVSLLKFVLGALLVALGVRQWRGRPRGDQSSALPKWMSSLDHFRPPKAFALGALLSGANPKNALLTVGAAAAIAETGIEDGQEAIALAAFIAIGTFSVGGPVVAFLVLGERSRTPLESLKSWMAANHTVIMAVLTLVIGSKLFGDGLAGL